MTTFINLSGGLDSTYFLWKLLSEGSEKIIVHHCLYSKKRSEMERQACENIIRELNRPSRITYITSSATFANKPDRDIIVMASMGAFAVRHLHIDKVLLCYSKEESPELDTHLKKHKSIHGFNPLHRYTIANDVFQQIYRKNKVKFYFWEQEKGLVSRKTMIDELPDNLLRHVSFCRNPSPKKRYCGRCFTCRRTLKYMGKKLHLWKLPL
jgi:7-cyano-7-deazaguanine synthase in queuosine biosynthesis